MVAQRDTVQATLPLDLFQRLQQVRVRYAAALQGAAKGDFTRAGELRCVTRWIGRLLAQEAKKSAEERGGLRMLDISLAVDRLFPELRGWTQHEIAERQRRRLLALHANLLGRPTAHPGKAS